MTYRDRRLARAERLREWADKRERKSAAAFEGARRIADAIPFGQPILVGHHSERHARRDAERIHNGMSRGVEHAAKARSMDSRADEIERQAEQAIYSDDADAIERLREKIAGLEAQRTRIKLVNAAIRKHGLAHAADAVPLTEEERRALLQLATLCPYHHVETRGFPSYTLQNLGGTLTRLRKRLAALSGATAPATMTQAADTATARAGLVITAGMTTPTRPGKSPRPVWTVTGNLAMWRPLLMRVGGAWYRGAFSFWEDPAADIEAACTEAESQVTNVLRPT